MVIEIRKFFHNETLRNGLFFTIFSFINKGVNFLLLIILAKYISPTEYGYWSLFGTIIMFIGYFIAMTTQGYLSISFFQEGMHGIKKTFSCIVSTSIIVSFLLCIFVFFLQPLLNAYLNFPWRYLYLAIGISFFTIYSNVCLDFFRIKKNAKLYGFFSCGSAILIFSVSIFFVKFLLLGWVGCVLAQLACASLFGLIGIWQFLRLGCLSLPDKTHWKKMLLWGIPLIPHLATNFIQQGCDRYIINCFYNVEQVGFFSFAYSLAAAIMMIGSGFNEANGVNIFETLSNRDFAPIQKIALLKKQKKNIFFIYLVSSTIIICLCCIFVPLALPQYAPSVKYFIFLAIYAFGQCLYFLYGNFLSFYSKTKKLMSITFSFAIIHLIISLCFTRYSVYYTCLSYCISQVGVVIFVRRNAIKSLEENLNCKIRRF